MKKVFCIIFVLLVAIVGCYKITTKQNNLNLMCLEMGMSKQEVLDIMGPPDLNEAYRSLYGKSVVILFYYTQRKWADGSRTKDECTPVVFENGELIGWGDEFYRTKMDIDVNLKYQ